MKNLLIFASITLAAYSCLLAGEPVKPPQTNHVNTDYVSAVKVTQNEWISLTGAYGSANGTVTTGGNLNKTDLQNFLNSLPAASTLVYFRFAEDATYHKTCLEFSGGKKAPVTCIRNGGATKAFCPTACNLKSGTCPNAVELSYENYKSLSISYQEAYPDSTLGGNIDKLALQNIINSLPGGMTIVNFNFCTDVVHKQTSVIFTGGTIGQPDNQLLYLRNGLTSVSFCPTNCNMDN